MTDDEIIHKDEIGECPCMEVELELNDTIPFFIKPYPIREEDKVVTDKEMHRGVLLGILKKGLRSYSSTGILIPRKITQVPRIVTDFRVLNSRIVKICSYSIPLLKDILMALGMSGVGSHELIRSQRCLL